MTGYYVTYHVMNGSIGLITVKQTHICVGQGAHDEVWAQIVEQIRMVEPTAKIVGYWIDNEWDDINGSEFFY